MDNKYIMKNAQIIDVEKEMVYTGSLYVKDGYIEKIYENQDKIPLHLTVIDLEESLINGEKSLINPK